MKLFQGLAQNLSPMYLLNQKSDIHFVRAVLLCDLLSSLEASVPLTAVCSCQYWVKCMLHDREEKAL